MESTWYKCISSWYQLFTFCGPTSTHPSIEVAVVIASAISAAADNDGIILDNLDKSVDWNPLTKMR